MRILVTGSRNWTDRAAIFRALLTIGVSATHDHSRILVSGACPTGADALAEDVARGMGWHVERHPADWDAHGKAAGPKRNQHMVELGADICVAFPLPNSRGTYDCMKRAAAADIPVHVIGATS